MHWETISEFTRTLTLLMPHPWFCSQDAGSLFINIQTVCNGWCAMLFSCPVVSASFCNPMDCRPARLLCLWDFLGKSTGVGSHFLLQGIFLTQGSNQHLLHYKWILYHWDTTETLQCTIDRLKLYLKLFSLIDLAEQLSVCSPYRVVS